jgi:DNA-binding beta-propeller fold protein YncE
MADYDHRFRTGKAGTGLKRPASRCATILLGSMLLLGLSDCAGSRLKVPPSEFNQYSTLQVVAVIDDSFLHRASQSDAASHVADQLLAAPVSISLSAATRAGGLLIADRQTGAILEISDAGIVINQTVLSGGTRDISSRSPRVIRLDFGGALYLCDGISRHATIYDSHLQPVGELVPPYDALGVVEGSITGMALGTFGEIYLVDGINGRVYRFDASGRFLSSFRGEQSGWARLSRPAGAACVSTDGSVYVCDPGQRRVVVFDNAGIPQRSFGEGELNEPVAVALDGREQAYVADTKARAIGVFDTSGRLVGRIDSSNLSCAPMEGPTDVAIADSVLYIADPPTGRVLKILIRNPGR